MLRISLGLGFAVALVGCKNDNRLIDNSGNEQVDDVRPACIEVDPGSLVFDPVEVGVDLPITKIVTIRSTCEADLELYGLELDDPQAPFELGTLGAVRLPQGSSTDFTVTFDPQTARDPFVGKALITSNDDDDSTVAVDLTGAGIAPIIEVSPPQYDFGDPYIGCPLSQPYTITNVGTADLVVTDVTFATGSIDFASARPEGLPITLVPNASFDVDVDYMGLDDFADQGFLTVISNDPWTPEVLVTATGNARPFGANVDTYEQPLKAGTDIIFVVDNSCSMSEEQANLADNFESFIDTLEASDSDYRVGVITTDNPNFQGPVIDNNTPDPVGTFQAQALVGINGSGNEMGLEMPYQCTQPAADAGPGGQFLRDTATLSIVILSDEEDHSGPSYYSLTPVQDYIDYWLGIKGGNTDLVRVNAIAGDVPNPTCGTAEAAHRYLEAVDATGGEFVSICATDWGANLEQVALGSISQHHSFALTEAPVPLTIVVRIDGIETTVGWHYDERVQSIVFNADSIPAGGSTIEISYEKMPDSCEQ
jgi:hypothetical protein